jgi:hypothetical protein
METLLRDVCGKTYRVKCHHGCQHAGDGVLFKFIRGSQENMVQVEEIGLDRHNTYKLDCTVRRGTSDNWALLKQEGEKRPYTFAIHRAPRNQFEMYIAGQDAAVDYMLEEVDPRYEDRTFYERRPSLKKARHGPARDSDEEAEMEEGARQGEYCAHSRSRSRSRTRSRSDSRDDSRDSRDDDEDSRSRSYSSEEEQQKKKPAPKRKPVAKATGTKATSGAKTGGGSAKKATASAPARKTSVGARTGARK